MWLPHQCMPHQGMQPPSPPCLSSIFHISPPYYHVPPKPPPLLLSITSEHPVTPRVCSLEPTPLSSGSEDGYRASLSRSVLPDVAPATPRVCRPPGDYYVFEHVHWHPSWRLPIIPLLSPTWAQISVAPFSDRQQLNPQTYRHILIRVISSYFGTMPDCVRSESGWRVCLCQIAESTFSLCGILLDSALVHRGIQFEPPS